MKLIPLLFIAFGGALGAMLRAYVSHLIPASFPWATFVVNVVGSFIIGFVYALEGTTFHISPNMRVMLTTGFCGALTTFSTFSYQTLALFNEGRPGAAALNILLNVALTLLAAWLGIRCANSLLSPVGH